MALKSILELLGSAPYDSDLTPAKLKFASGRPGAGMPGSLYFKSGRIRLVHDKSPKISKHERIRRYPLSEGDFKNVKHSREYKQRKWNAIEDRLKNDGNPHSITLNKGKRLIEFFEDEDGKTKLHPSRGKLIKAPPLNQVQINLIAIAADSRCNAVMKAVYPFALSLFR